LAADVYGATLFRLAFAKTEFDADLCQSALIGSRPFEATFRTLQVIDFAWKQVRPISSSAQENQLPDNLPRQLEPSLKSPTIPAPGLAVREADTADTADFAHPR
jgi:hypothetical protein